MKGGCAVDTSVAVPYLMKSHTSHELVRHRLADQRLYLTSHSLAETYSVLTRLPRDARLAAQDASALIEANFPEIVMLSTKMAQRLHIVLAQRGITGGAVYDAMVALAAIGRGLSLATRDSRAATTYATLSATVETIAG